jgi:hypothetical protein
MKHHRIVQYIFLLALTTSIVWFIPSPVFAQACTPPLSGDFTVSTDCAFSGSANGVDSGSGANTATLTVHAGILTVSSNQTIGFGKIVLSGGVIALPTDNSSRLVAGAGVWYTDEDNDHYPEDTTAVTSVSKPGANYKRKSTMTAITLDCYPNADAHPGQTAFFAAHRGDGSFDYDCDSAITKARNSCSCSCTDGCGAAATCSVIQVVEATACGTTGINAGPATCTRTNDVYGTCVTCTANGSTTTTMTCR